MFVCHFVDPDLGVGTFFMKGGETEKQHDDFEIED